MSHLCDLFFIFSLIFFIINYITLLKRSRLLLHIFGMISWMNEANNFQIAKVKICLIFSQFQPGAAYKSVAYKKSVYSSSVCFIQGRTTCYFSIIWKHSYNGCFWLRGFFCVIFFYSFDTFMIEKGLKNYFCCFFIFFSSAKLRTLRTHVPTCLACLCDHMPTCLECSSGHVPTCLEYLSTLIAYVLICQHVLRAYLSCVLTFSRANLPCVLTCSRTNVSCMLTCSCAIVFCGIMWSRVNVPCAPRCSRVIT